MKAGKATGSDDLAPVLWKSHSWNCVGWLTKFFCQVIAEKKTPADFQRSIKIPIWKDEGGAVDCANYRPIRLLLHTMKVSERIRDRRICDIVSLSTDQCGFVGGCGTINAIHAARILIEMHGEKQKPLHVAFLDLKRFSTACHRKSCGTLFDSTASPKSL